MRNHCNRNIATATIAMLTACAGFYPGTFLGGWDLPKLPTLPLEEFLTMSDWTLKASEQRKANSCSDGQ